MLAIHLVSTKRSDNIIIIYCEVVKKNNQIWTMKIYSNQLLSYLNNYGNNEGATRHVESSLCEQIVFPRAAG